jgi:hypothetical protein
MLARSLATATFLLATAACFDDGSGIEIIDWATVEGRVEQGTSGAALASGPLTQSAADARTAAVVAVETDGSLTTLATALIATGGSFRIEEVPRGRTGLQVVARTDAGAEVGRVQLHEKTEAEATFRVAPIVPETTVEGMVAARLRANGNSAAAANSGGIALFVRMGAAEASAVALADAEVTAVADAFAAAHAWAEAAASEVATDLSGGARAQLLAEAAIDFAAARHGGQALDVAHEAFLEVTLDAFSSAGATAEGVALVTASEMAAALDASVAAAAGTRLAIARQTALVNLRARERLAAEAGGDAPGSSGAATASALVTARADIETAATVAEVQAALDATAGEVEAALLEGILSVTGELEAVLAAQVEAALAAAMIEADLAAQLGAAANAQAAAQALADYRARIATAVEAVVALLPTGASIDAEAVVTLMIAGQARGSG